MTENRFKTEGRPVSCERYGEGHINETYLVVTDTGRRYILQKLSKAAFKDIPALMENVIAVTGFLADKGANSLRLIPADTGSLYCTDENGEYWRMYDFVENSLCLQRAETPGDFYQSAIAFGEFQKQLREFPAETLHETIPNFHNTPDRYRIFREALENNLSGRAENAGPEIEFALRREKEADALFRMNLPLRVTHNDTKLNNVLLDKNTRKPLCVIDLDTIMPGFVAFDFGDSIRFGASTGAEDEKDLGKIEMSIDLYNTFKEGFVTACDGLTDAEIESLRVGAKLMTLECGVRFLTDYLDGDRYFATSRPEHNLDRTRTQFKLVADMEKKWDEM